MVQTIIADVTHLAIKSSNQVTLPYTDTGRRSSGKEVVSFVHLKKDWKIVEHQQNSTIMSQEPKLTYL